MESLLIIVISFLTISKSQSEYPSCRTNCSINGTIDSDCWHQSLAYRSADLIEQLFSFSSLSVHVDTYQRHHSAQLNDSIKFIDHALEINLLNESIDAKLSIDLFTNTRQNLINLCQNLTSTPIESLKQLPSLSCPIYSCTSDMRNYIVLFILSAAICSSILIICIVQTVRVHRKRNPVLTIFSNNAVINSPSTRLVNSVNS